MQVFFNVTKDLQINGEIEWKGLIDISNSELHQSSGSADQWPGGEGIVPYERLASTCMCTRSSICASGGSAQVEHARMHSPTASTNGEAHTCTHPPFLQPGSEQLTAQ